MRKSRTRINRISEKHNKKQAIRFTIGIIILILVLIQFGPLIINAFGNLVYSIRGADNEVGSELKGDEVLIPPTLNEITAATQSSSFKVSGTSPDKGTVEIYVNDELKQEIFITSKLDFSEEVTLRKGENSIKARYVKKGKTSSFTDEYIISYTTEKPKLEVNAPQENQQFTKADRSIFVKGSTDPENTILVNTFRAIVKSNGEFEYLLQLNDGENKISIQAVNNAGATTQKDLSVFYTP